MILNQIRISDAEMEALAITAAVGNIALEDLVGAAAWAFAEQEEDFQDYYMGEIWLQRETSALETRPRREMLKERLYGLVRRFFSAFG